MRSKRTPAQEAPPEPELPSFGKAELWEPLIIPGATGGAHGGPPPPIHDDVEVDDSPRPEPELFTPIDLPGSGGAHGGPPPPPLDLDEPVLPVAAPVAPAPAAPSSGPLHGQNLPPFRGDEPESAAPGVASVGGASTDDEVLVSLFQLFSLDASATMDQVRDAYLRLVTTHHPDNFKDEAPEVQREHGEILLMVLEAYAIVSEKLAAGTAPR